VLIEPVTAAAIVALSLTVAVSGVLLLRHRGSAPAGGLLALSAVGAASALALDAAGAPNRAVEAALTAAALLGFPLAVVAYPRLRWRHPVDFAAVVTVAAAGGVAVAVVRDPNAVAAMATIGVLTLICHLWWRLECGSMDERRPLLWLTLALGIAGIVAGFAVFVGNESSGVGLGGISAGVLAFVVVAPAMVLGLRRPDVVDVRGLLVHAVVLGVTVLLYLSVFVGIASTLQALNHDRTPKVATLGLVGAACALGVRPTMVVLRGVIDQLLFGDRPDPLRAATHVVDRIGDDPVLALRAIREALVLPYASLRADGAELAASGTAVTHTRTIPLPLGGDSVGEIVVGLRAGDLTLAADDEHVLRIVAPLLAQTIRARALARDLQASRGEAIAAIEEERRRLRRDLHDGLGPTLTGVAFATDAARNKLRDDPAAADELLARLRADTSDAIGEIRRLVEGLRPPALDELGLVAAVRQQAAHMHTAAGAPLAVTIDAPEPMPELPAAAEVAAYRIVVEALTNVARHSASPSAHVTLVLDPEALDITIDDAGASGAPWRPGVGMSSMRERAEQVGGVLDAGARPTGGRVRASIPLG
jgi:two-component system NarL family sensor kinase